MTSTTAELVSREDPVDINEWMAIAGFLAGYTGNTRVRYATDPRSFSDSCHSSQLTLFPVRRMHLELFARWMQAEGQMRSTVARRLSTLASFSRYCHAEGIAACDPAANVPTKVDHESRTVGLDRNELSALLVQAGCGTPCDHALVTLLAMKGLRVSEALNADGDAPRPPGASDLYLGERSCGPIFLTGDGRRMDRSAADRIVKRLAGRADPRSVRSAGPTCRPVRGRPSSVGGSESPIRRRGTTPHG